MIFQWFFWKYLKLSFLISFLITFLFLITQMIRFDQIIFNLPLKESFPFLLFLFFYYLIYLLPLSLFIAFSLNLFELKENKKLKIIQSFGIDPKSIYIKSFLHTIPLIVAIAFVFYLIKEEDIGYLRSNLALKYYTYILTSAPPNTFHSLGEFTLYVGNRRGNKLEGVFFKFKEGVVIAERAYVKEEEIRFEKGSLLTQKEDKTFSTDFEIYRLNLSMAISDRDKGYGKKYLVGLINAISPLFLMGISYLLVNKIEHHHRFYYFIGIISIFHQLLLLLLKQNL